MRSKNYSILFIIFSLVLLNACGKGKNTEKEAPKVCTNTCASWQVRTDYPDCECVRPEYTLPDAKLQAQLIEAALKGNINFLKEQIDVKHINPNAYLGLSEIENLLSFRESLSQNKFLYNNIKKTTNNFTLAALAASDTSNGGKVLKFLIERKADLSKRSIADKTPAEIAIESKNYALLPEILKNGGTGDFFSGDNNPLKKLIESGKSKSAMQTINALVKYAADNNIDISDSIPSIAYAIEQKDKEMVTMLIDVAKADPTQTDDNGMPVISLAALKGNKDIVNLLLLGGASIEQANNDGQTPLMVLIDKAASSDNIKTMLDFLFVNGADVNATDLKGQTPLFYAVKKNKPSIIQILLAQGADINARDNRGESVLFRAAEKDDTKMVKFLLDNGASPKLKNKKQLDAATLAVQNGFMDTYDLIQNYR